MRFMPGYTDPFMSPVSGKVQIEYQPLPNLYTWEGDRFGYASPSPALIDLRLDIIELRGLINKSNYLPTDFIYRGNELNVATPYQTILLKNLTNLSTGKFWIGDVSSRPVESSFTPLTSELPHNQIFLGNSDNVATPAQLILIENIPNLGLSGISYDGHDVGQIFEGTDTDRPIISNFLGQLADDVSVLKTKVSDLEDAVDEINLEITDIYADIADINAAIAVIDGQILVLQGQVSALEADVLLIQGQITVIQGQITTLFAAVAGLQTQIDNLKLNNIPADNDIDISGHRVIDAGDPVNLQDYTTKSWVLAQIGGVPGSVWVDQSSTPVNMLPNTYYVSDTAGLLTLNVPTTVAFGTRFRVAGNGSGGWLIQMNSGQVSHMGSLATSIAGSLASSNRYDCVDLLCVVANSTFTVISSIGNIIVS